MPSCRTHPGKREFVEMPRFYIRDEPEHGLTEHGGFIERGKVVVASERKPSRVHDRDAIVAIEAIVKLELGLGIHLIALLTRRRCPSKRTHKHPFLTAARLLW